MTIPHEPRWSDAPARIEVSLTALLDALRLIRTARTWDKHTRAVLGPAPGGLRVELGSEHHVYRSGAISAGVVVPGSGVWRIEARISGRHMVKLLQAPPSQDPLTIRVAGPSCYIGTTAELEP